MQFCITLTLSVIVPIIAIIIMDALFEQCDTEFQVLGRKELMDYVTHKLSIIDFVISFVK